MAKKKEELRLTLTIEVEKISSADASVLLKLIDQLRPHLVDIVATAKAKKASKISTGLGSSPSRPRR
jgi:hypothetical protein